MEHFFSTVGTCTCSYGKKGGGRKFVATQIWRTRNAVCFENKRVKFPIEIICMICSFLTYWAGLLKEDLKPQVLQGAEAVKSAALLSQAGQAVTHKGGASAGSL